MSWEVLWRDIDPQVSAQVEDQKKEFPGWTPEITTESWIDFFAFKPESVVERIAPRAAMWIHARDDERIPAFESQSFYAKAGEPKRLVLIDGGHFAYLGSEFPKVMENAVAWFREHL